MQRKTKILNFLKLITGLTTEEAFEDTIDNLILGKFYNSREEATYATSHEIVKEIFTKGNCGNAYFILKELYPESKPYLYNKEHILTKIDDEFYDINGIYTVDDKSKLEEINDDEALEWTNNYSFAHRGPLI